MKLFANFLKVAVLLSVFSVVAGQLGRWHFLLDLASHFRLQATFALLISGLGLCWLRDAMWAAFALASGVVLAVLLLPYLPSQSRKMEHEYRLFLMNVLTRNPRKADVISLIRESDADFVVE